MSEKNEVKTSTDRLIYFNRERNKIPIVAGYNGKDLAQVMIQ